MSGSNAGPERVPTGIAGLDEMLSGGIPQGNVVLVSGLPGTGKTCLGLQFLAAGIAQGEKGVFLSLEEDIPALLETAEQFGWPLAAASKSGLLKIVRLDPKQAKQSLERIQSDLPKELKQYGARRLVVDSVSLLNMLSDNEPGRRATLFALAAACRGSGATALLTAEANPEHPEVSRDGLSEYVADGVILLGYSSGTDGRQVGLALRVLKMRRTAHARSFQPYAIGTSGLNVDAKAVDFSRGF